MRMLKRGLAVIILMIMMGMTVLAAPRSGWIQKSDGTWQYRKEDGTLATWWYQVDDKWYFMDKNGVMQTGWLDLEGGISRCYLLEDGSASVGWQEIDGKWYYTLRPTEGVLFNTTTPDGYYVNAYGEWSPKLSETRIFPTMSEAEQELFDMVNDLLEKRTGKRLVWDETAHKAARLAVTKRAEGSFNGYENCLRETGYEGYEVMWIYYGGGTSERFIFFMDDNAYQDTIFNQKYNRMGLSIEFNYNVKQNSYYPFYAIYLME